MSWLLPWLRRPRLPNRGTAVWWNATSGRVSGRTGVFCGGVAGSLARRSVCGAPAPPRVLRCTDRKTHRSGSPPCLHMRCEAFPAGHRKPHASRVLHPGGTAATDGDGTSQPRSQPRSQPLCAAKFASSPASSPCRRARRRRSFAAPHEHSRHDPQPFSSALENPPHPLALQDISTP